MHTAFLQKKLRLPVNFSAHIFRQTVLMLIEMLLYLFMRSTLHKYCGTIIHERQIGRSGFHFCYG